MLQFGVAGITVSGANIARLYNVSVNVTLDSAPLRGDGRIYPDHVELYNGNVEGTFENGEVILSAIAEMLGADQAASSLTVTSNSVLGSGLDLVVSSVTNGVTGTLTFYNVKFPGISFTIDRENYTMPSTSFIVAGETSASGGRVWRWSTT